MLYPSLEKYVGVRTLWVKVIIRAVFDWVSYKDSQKIQQLKLAESAHGWLFKPSEVFNSFENVCFYLDMSPSNIRNWAQSLSPDQVLKIELSDRAPSPKQAFEDLNLKALVEDVDDL